ncbi:hypothetical protein [Anaeromassilibacillus senegalensis]|uniref:hypothetical protein n=1 Tax=Anaeromassilibacillus senegalensis TaxID=1673717 RepID=UPI00067F92CC|nr:hypothetical protein [Anaeromassilibacillus senegalensis]
MPGIQIVLDQVAIARLGEAAERAARMAIDALKTDVVSAQVMPYDMGDMQDTQTFVDVIREGDRILATLTTGAPQARRLYYHPEYNFQKGNNPNAGGLWLQPWLNGEKKSFVQDAFAEFYRKEAGL